jgi:hypothetical protein
LLDTPEKGSDLTQKCQLFCAQSPETVMDWARQINQALRAATHRPQRLLVLLNPFGGARQARKVWQKSVFPVFETAGALLCQRPVASRLPSRSFQGLRHCWFDVSATLLQPAWQHMWT